VNALNQRAMETGTAWLRSEMHGGELRVGPFVIPRRTACLQCAGAVPRRDAAAAPRGEGIATATLAASFVCMEALRGISDVALPVTLNAVSQHRLVRGTIRRTSVARDPRCTVCGERA
jgi:hypothetical protein